MKPAFGWTLLSRDALKRAESRLSEEVEGVRDEVGFLAIHQAYADRFFPGTSVLHTRLRYALFVPWLYQRLASRRLRGRVEPLLQREEVALAGRLKEAGEDGVIGGRSYPAPTSQPPSMVYWTALGTWRILRPLPSGAWPPRASVHRALTRVAGSTRLHDDDRQLLEETEEVFAGVPAPPDEWNEPEAEIDFRLRAEEARFLRARLLAVPRPGSDGMPSLLARLAEVPISASTDLWAAKVTRAAAPEDRPALERARQAAALAAVGRGVYAALVEDLRDRDDRLPTENLHRSALKGVAAEFRRDALALDVDALHGDAVSGGGFGETIPTVLRETQVWLRDPRAPVTELHRVYEAAERLRKGRRARLSTSLAGREKRAEWVPSEHPEARPLHYRWGNVRRLLLDLQGHS